MSYASRQAYSGQHLAGNVALVEPDQSDTVTSMSESPFTDYLEGEPVKSGRLQRVREAASSVGLAATCAIPVLDLALTDAAFGKLYQATGDMDHAAQAGIVSGAIVLETIVLNTIVAHNKNLRGGFEGFKEYTDKRQAEMSRPRKLLSDVANSPFTVLGYMALPFEKLGNRVSEMESPVAKAVGKVIVDSAEVQAISTTGVALRETGENNPPKLKRNAALGLEFAAVWTGGLADGIQALSDDTRVGHTVLHNAYRAGHLLTSVNLANPLTTPWADLTMGVVTGIVAATSWNMHKFNNQPKQVPETPLVSAEIADTVIDIDDVSVLHTSPFGA